MTDEEQIDPKDAVITLEGDDGKSYSCQVLNVFEFEGKEYALLLKVDKNGGKEDEENKEGALVIMRLIERDEQSIFQTIESDDEFQKVVSHVEELARQAESELEEKS